MSIRAQIFCINKSDRFNPHERIRSVGGRNFDGAQWKLPQEDAITGIEAGKYSFYVSVGGHLVDVIVAVSRYGHKYIKTENDSDQPDNLLSLPECP